MKNKLAFLSLSAGLLGQLPAAIVLNVDINDSDSTAPLTAAGYTAYVVGDSTLKVGSVSLDINPAKGAFNTNFQRATPVDAGAFTLGALFQDGITAAGGLDTAFYLRGLDAEIGGLKPGKRYAVTGYSYDSSGGSVARVSDWHLRGMGGRVFGVNNYQFLGTSLPTADTANNFTITALADNDGRLVLSGRPNAAGAIPSLVLNGLTVDELADAAVVQTPVLAVEFNDRGRSGAANTASGFSEFLLPGTEGTAVAVGTAASRAFGPISVSLASSAAMNDAIANFPVLLDPTSQALGVREYISAPLAANGNLTTTVSGLTAGGRYLVEVWSYAEPVKTVNTSDWRVNGVTLWDDHTFNGTEIPRGESDYLDLKMTGAFTADATGNLIITATGATAATASTVYLNALRVTQLAPPVPIDLGGPVISEFLANNNNGISDENGDRSDWIEIFNASNAPVNLAGWSLTDNPARPAKWVFPANTNVPAQGFLRVWASNKNRITDLGNLHTNFSLTSNAGGYLALISPTSSVASIYTALPLQRADTSYGSFGPTAPQTLGYFRSPSPEVINSLPPVPGFVADTVFDVTRGFYASPQTVKVTCATPGAVIRFTADGSLPTATSAVVPTTGIVVDKTTVLRARAFAPPLDPTNADTHTYIFRATIQNQTNTPGPTAIWPTTWGSISQGTVPANYQMDPDVVTTTEPGYSIAESLAALPTISVVMAPTDFLGSNGIYQNSTSRGDTWERPCSVEYFELNGDIQSARAGIVMHGTSSRNPFRMQKHSFRLSFRDAYGDTKFNYDFLKRPGRATSFDKIVLRACFTDSWGLVSYGWTPNEGSNRYRPHEALYFRDYFVKRSFAEMGHLSSTGRHAHLYVNGLYWGLHEMSERVNGDFLSDYLGGASTDYDLLADFSEISDGSKSDWESLFAYVNANDPAVKANYEEIQRRVDVTQFADYYLLHLYGDTEDWPHKNGYSYRNRNGADRRWKFMPWDQEIAMNPLVNIDRYTVGAGNTTTDATAGRLFTRLRLNPEFRLLFADRVHKHMNNGGALSLLRTQNLWQSTADILDKGIVAESARWGDTADETPYGYKYTNPTKTVFKRSDWLAVVANVKNVHIPSLHTITNTRSTIRELQSLSPQLYPTVVPPTFAQHGGSVPATGFALTMTGPAGGTIYYTTDGTDPRTPFTSAAVGTAYSAPVAISQTTLVSARVLNGTTWSPLTAATFIVGTAASSANLTISELNYNPPGPDTSEFLELYNFSAETIDLSGVSFVGIEYTIPQGTTLAPQGRLTIARDIAAFTTVYGATTPKIGPYSGELDNAGEEIVVVAANGDDILRLAYATNGLWPSSPDAEGRSLVQRRPSAANNAVSTLNDPTNWRASVLNAGTPGAGDSVPFAGDPLANTDGDAYPAILEYLLGGSDAQPNDITAPQISFDNFTTNGVSGTHAVISAVIRPGADAATLTAQFSTDLSGPWQTAAYVNERANGLNQTVVRWRSPRPVSADQRLFLRFRGSL